jgi:RNA recognition motif-containing protein
LFSHTGRLADSQADKTASAEAAQDVVESLAQSEADIQEAVQEVAPAESQQVERPRRHKGKYGAFIRNIVFEVTEEQLQQAFEKYGNVVSAYIARDPRGLSKGYGFVEFDSEEALQQACDAVNGSFWHGRRITCVPRQEEPVKVRTERQPMSTPTAQLFIGNIPFETTDAELNRLFKDIANCTDIRVAVDRATGWPRGFAHADFTTVEAAQEAYKRLQGLVIGNRELRVDYATGYIRRKGQGGNQQSGGTAFRVITDPKEGTE